MQKLKYVHITNMWIMFTMYLSCEYITLQHKNKKRKREKEWHAPYAFKPILFSKFHSHLQTQQTKMVSVGGRGEYIDLIVIYWFNGSEYNHRHVTKLIKNDAIKRKTM